MPKFAAQIDAMKIPLKGLVPESGATLPATPAEGQIAYDTANDCLRVYTRGVWHVLLMSTLAGGALREKLGDFNQGSQTGDLLVWNGTDDWDAQSSIEIAQVDLLDSALADRVVYTRQIISGTGLSGGGNLSADRTLSVVYGTTAGTAAQGNDARLSDARTPLAHTHTKANITDFAHTHPIADLPTDATVPAALGTAAAGSAATIARRDHVHAMPTLTQVGNPTADRSMNNFKITGLATPVAATDAATKGYVDASAQGLNVKQSVRAASVANLTLSGTQTVDGVSLSVGDRILVKNQTTGSANGIYVVAAGAWTRAADADASAEVNAGMFTFVEEGLANDNTGWVLTTNNPITVGTTALVFEQFSGAGQINAGDGLYKEGNNLHVYADGTTIEISGDQVGVKSLGINSPQIAADAVTSPKIADLAVTTAKLNDLAVTDAKVAAANKDGAAGTPSMRTLGTGAAQAAAGNHTHALTSTSLTGTLPVTKGGTGATTGSAALGNLGGVHDELNLLPALTAGVWTTVTRDPVAQLGAFHPYFYDMATNEQVVLDFKWISSTQYAVKADVAVADMTIACSTHAGG